PGRDTGHRVLGEGAAARTWKKIFRFHPPPAFSDHGPQGPGSRCHHATACNADSSTAADHIETTRLARPCLVHKGSQCTFTLSCYRAAKAIGTQPLSQR